jgi:hypothetical protein
VRVWVPSELTGAPVAAWVERNTAIAAVALRSVGVVERVACGFRDIRRAVGAWLRTPWQVGSRRPRCLLHRNRPGPFPVDAPCGHAANTAACSGTSVLRDTPKPTSLFASRTPLSDAEAQPVAVQSQDQAPCKRAGVGRPPRRTGASADATRSTGHIALPGALSTAFPDPSNSPGALSTGSSGPVHSPGALSAACSGPLHAPAVLSWLAVAHCPLREATPPRPRGFR